MKPDLFFNWFDLVVVGILALGVMVGRKRGMSVELLPVLQWLLIVFLGALAYDPVGRALVDFTGLNTLFCFITAYLLVAVGIKLLFVVLKRMTGEKLLGSDTFGTYEYYLGIVAGGIRFLCILLFVLALIHAPQTSDADLEKQLRAQREWAGAIYFPPLGSIQRSIFDRSLTGQTVKRHLHGQLISVGAYAGSGRNTETIYRTRQREVDEVIGPRR
jgi:uncharacterized membrane protein required for colicin V production